MRSSGLRYFATNRQMENLGRVHSETKGSLKEKDHESVKKADRDLRIKLQQGGYYFVDMRSYMAYYFGAVDTTKMPLGAVVQTSDETVFEGFLADQRIGRVAICIHGFNVHLPAAHQWFRILVETMRNAANGGPFIIEKDDLDDHKNAREGSLIALIGFSWPSNGSVLAYNRDQMDAASSAQALAGLISRIHLHGKKVDLICHSMGNYLACNMLQGLITKTFIPACFSSEYVNEWQKGLAERKSAAKVLSEGDRTALLQANMRRLQRHDGTDADSRKSGEDCFIDRYIMLAPDVERRHITKAPGNTTESDYIGPFHSGLEHLVREVWNIYSRFDSALNVSNWEKKPKDALLSVAEGLNSLTFGLLDFLERNPDYKWEQRLGSAPHPSTSPGNVVSVNATELAGRKIDHSDHIDSRQLAERIAKILTA